MSAKTGLNPLGDLAVEVFRLNGALLAQGDRMTRDLGMSSARWQVLGALELAAHPLPVSQIARNMGLTRQSVQRLVNDLAADGFLCFNHNPQHQRAKLVLLTTKGRKIYQTIMRRQAEWSKSAVSAARLSEQRVHEAAALVRRLRGVIKER